MASTFLGEAEHSIDGVPTQVNKVRLAAAVRDLSQFNGGRLT